MTIGTVDLTYRPRGYSKLVNIHTHNIETISPQYDIKKQHDPAASLVQAWAAYNANIGLYDIKRYIDIMEGRAEDDVIIHLNTNLGRWLQDLNFGKNMYDSDQHLYLLTFKLDILRSIVMWAETEFAGLTLDEYIGGMFSEST